MSMNRVRRSDRLTYEVHHEMRQTMVVCRRLPALFGTSDVGLWQSQRARRRTGIVDPRGRSNAQTAMHKLLSRALPRLSAPETIVIVRVSGHLSGLHPVLLHRPGTRVTGAFAAISDRTRVGLIAVEIGRKISPGRGYGHNFPLAIAAPSLSACSFAHTMLSYTMGSVRTAVPKPQSTPAIRRSRSITCA